jgi:E3 ubiquitin-protein ligase DOA10
VEVTFHFLDRNLLQLCVAHKGGCRVDIVFVLLALAFFVLCWGFVELVDRI